MLGLCGTLSLKHETVCFTPQRPLTAAQLYTSTYGCFCPFHADFYPWEIVYAWQVIIQVSQTRECWHHRYTVASLPWSWCVKGSECSNATLWRWRHVWRRASVIWTECRWNIYSRNLSHFVCFAHTHKHARTRPHTRTHCSFRLKLNLTAGPDDKTRSVLTQI